MTAANNPLQPRSISRRAVAILLLIGLATAGMPFLLAGAVAFALQVPFTESKNATFTLLGVVAGTAVLILRLRGYLARGPLVADAGREPRRKLLAWLAAISLTAGVIILEAARREAKIAPVHSRIQQLVALRKQILTRVQNLLDRQRALLVNVPDDLKEAQQIGQMIQQAQSESRGLGILIDSEIAEEHRLTYRLLPEWSEIQQSLDDLGNGVAKIPSHPWDVLASAATLQLYLAAFAIVNGLLMLLIALGHRQIRENGIWQGGALVRWKHFGSYRWENDTLVAQFGKTQSAIALPIAPEDKPAVENLLAFKIATQG